MKRWAMIAAVLVAVFVLAAGSTVCAKDKKDPQSHYELDFTGTTGTAEAGKEGSIVVAIKPTDGYKINAEYPFKLAVADVEGLEFPQKKYVKADVKDISKPVLSIPFKAVKQGKYSVTLNFNFAVCTADICEIRKPSVQVPVEVK